MSLSEYLRKRDFAKTREPSAGSRVVKDRAIFVVQLHHAGRRHYDFRLQVGDTLKSWAVPKGPSFDPSVKRLAAEVEDHPVDYADFSGMIPSGEYGAGHVATFDRGVWSTEGDAQAQLDKGHLRFELFGEKLKGAWHLIRSARKSRQPEWLLVKHKDAYSAQIEADDLLADVPAPPNKALDKSTLATKAATPKLKSRLATRPPARGRWAKRAGAMDGSAVESLSAQYFEPQLARLAERTPDSADWLHEIKWDGYRLLTTLVGGKLTLWSRNGLDYTKKLPEIVAALRALGLQNAAFDGELVALKDGISDFGLLQSTLSGVRNSPLAYVLFDLIHLEGFSLRGVPLHARKSLLQEVLAGAQGRLAYSSHSVGNGKAAFEVASRAGLEGIISKRANGHYQAGRNDDWRKSKRLESDEFAVVGYTAAKGSRAGFGSLLLARADAKTTWRYAGRVGSGFSDEQLRTLNDLLKAQPVLEKPAVHVDSYDAELRRATWLAPQFVVEVLYRGFGNQGLLRQPSLKGIRMDKSIADLTGAPAAKDQTPQAVPETPKISSPGRIVYPDRGTTKQQVANYYAAVMDWFLPEIIGRPLSVIRCPDGIAEACFFQKHLTAGVKLADTVAILEDSGKTADYLVINDAASVMELVQFNALEFHPWGSTAVNPDRANRIVFDLDPGPGVAWTEVKAAARRIHDLLESLSLKCFLRTSGGKGLHVVVPLNPGCDWDLVKPFAHAFAESMAQAEPMKFVATASKKLREGRIFIDYLRNGRGATSVASYSLRAREGAPVAVNLRWDELARLKAANAFNIDSVPKRLARLKADPWEGINDVNQDLSRISASE